MADEPYPSIPSNTLSSHRTVCVSSISSGQAAAGWSLIGEFAGSNPDLAGSGEVNLDL